MFRKFFGGGKSDDATSATTSSKPETQVPTPTLPEAVVVTAATLLSFHAAPEFPTTGAAGSDCGSDDAVFVVATCRRTRRPQGLVCEHVIERISTSNTISATDTVTVAPPTMAVLPRRRALTCVPRVPGTMCAALGATAQCYTTVTAVPGTGVVVCSCTAGIVVVDAARDVCVARFGSFSSSPEPWPYAPLSAAAALPGLPIVVAVDTQAFVRFLVISQQPSMTAARGDDGSGSKASAAWHAKWLHLQCRRVPVSPNDSEVSSLCIGSVNASFALAVVSPTMTAVVGVAAPRRRVVVLELGATSGACVGELGVPPAPDASAMPDLTCDASTTAWLVAYSCCDLGILVVAAYHPYLAPTASGDGKSATGSPLAIELARIKPRTELADDKRFSPTWSASFPMPGVANSISRCLLVAVRGIADVCGGITIDAMVAEMPRAREDAPTDPVGTQEHLAVQMHAFTLHKSASSPPAAVPRGTVECCHVGNYATPNTIHPQVAAVPIASANCLDPTRFSTAAAVFVPAVACCCAIVSGALAAPHLRHHGEIGFREPADDADSERGAMYAAHFDAAINCDGAELSDQLARATQHFDGGSTAVVVPLLAIVEGTNGRPMTAENVASIGSKLRAFFGSSSLSAPKGGWGTPQQQRRRVATALIEHAELAHPITQPPTLTPPPTEAIISSPSERRDTSAAPSSPPEPRSNHSRGHDAALVPSPAKDFDSWLATTVAPTLTSDAARRDLVTGATAKAGASRSKPSKAGAIGDDVNETKNAMMEAQQRLEERGEKINEMGRRTQDLADNAGGFAEAAAAYRKQQQSSWW